MNIQSIPLIEPQFFTDNKGNSIVMLTKDYYNELLSRIEELEDLELYLEGKKDQEPGEPAEIVFKRIEENRAKNGR